MSIHKDISQLVGHKYAFGVLSHLQMTQALRQRCSKMAINHRFLVALRAWETS